MAARRVGEQDALLGRIERAHQPLGNPGDVALDRRLLAATAKHRGDGGMGHTERHDQRHLGALAQGRAG